MKYVLVTGGVVSGLGKGVTASSIGVLLKACGLRVTSIKIGTLLLLLLCYSSLKWCLFAYEALNLSDPYLNTDAGTMSPFEHGEVFVLDDGGEVNKYDFFFFRNFLKKLTSLQLLRTFESFLGKRWILILETTKGF